MDRKNSIVKEKPILLFRVVPSFMKRILSRKSVGSRSERIYDPKNAPMVPFQWEIKPGVPKYLYPEQIVPPTATQPPVEQQSQTLETPSLCQGQSSSNITSVSS